MYHPAYAKQSLTQTSYHLLSQTAINGAIKAKGAADFGNTSCLTNGRPSCYYPTVPTNRLVLELDKMTEHESKAHILATALAVFAEKGFAKASMNDVVRASGLSKGGVYWHFSSKAALITAIFDQFFVEQMAQLDEMLADAGSAAIRLRQLAATTATAVAEVAAQFPSSLDFYAMAARDDALIATLRQHFQSYQTRIASLVAEGIAAGEFREVDVGETAVAIISLFEGVLLLWGVMGDGHGPDLVARFDAAMELLLFGLATT